MTRIKIISIAAIAITRGAVSLLIHSKSQVKFCGREALLEQQDGQLAALNSEHERLSSMVANANNLRPDEYRDGLAKLRNEAEALKKQTNDLGTKQLKDSREPQPS